MSVFDDPVLDEAGDAAPVAVWDATDPGWFDGPWRERSAWLREHVTDTLGMLYRIDFYANGPNVTGILHCYHLDDDGQRHWTHGHTREPHDHSGCGPCREVPVTVSLDELPPEELL